MKIELKDTMALVIDYQEKLVPAMKENERFINNSVLLLKGLGILDVPKVITQQYTKGLGNTIPAIMNSCEINHELQESVIFDKISFSAMKNDDIAEKVKQLNKKNVIVCGCEAHICVLQTVIDLKELGYNVILVSDCIASRKDTDKNMAIDRAKQEGSIISTYEALLFELLETAALPEFKLISNLIK